MRNRFVLIGSGLGLLLATFALAQPTDKPAQATLQNAAEMKFITIPGLPTCAHGSVQKGDPTKGAFILYAKVAAKCSIPWHWHTANEHLMIVTGSAHVGMKEGKPLTLQPGGFAMLPSRHVHEFRAERACSFYLYSDGAFDIHYVDGQGKELPPADALKAVKETAATEMKPVS